jgi:endonuclease/exonuclease/phosphatase family metal-dependent hydrolase
MRNLLRAVIALAITAVALTVLPRPASAAAEPPRLRVISWNICGEAGGAPGSGAYCPFRNSPQSKIDEIARLTAENDANVLLLQEICGGADGSHTALLAAALGPDWSIRHAVAKRPDGRSDCRNPLTGELGAAIAVKAEVTATTDVPTVPEGTYNQQQLPLLCVRTAQWTTRICTVHILAAADDPRRQAQLDTVRELVWPDRHDVVLGGDFNHFPTSAALQPIATAFDECDRRSYGSGDVVNETTHLAWTAAQEQNWSKRDHIFASLPGSGTLFSRCDADQSRVDTSWYGVGGSHGWSDHAPLIAHLRTRTPQARATAGDLTADGHPDLVAVDAAGQLRLYAGVGDGRVVWPYGVIGTGGWSGAVISHRGDLTGDGTEDLLARIGDQLWVYPNRGYGRLGERVAVGGTGGWAGVSQVLSVGDVTGDGLPDVAAVRGDQLYLYPGDPANRPGLLPGRVIGRSGWTPMTLTAPGDADRDGRPDLLVRATTTGILYLYRGQADGSFNNRTVYGTGGWTPGNRPLLAAGDADGNGIADLWASAGDGTLQFYAGGTDSSGNPVDGERTQVGEGGWAGIAAIG